MTARRPRRIAADEAHAWARNLRLGNPFAKLVLSMLTLYVDGNGICFVGIEALADDTELSADTVRKRLAWLEQVGAIARFPQWLDAHGRRNGEGRGKRTSDEIRLLIGADPDGIEGRAKGRDMGDAAAAEEPVSPGPQQGLNQDQPSVGPGLAPPLALCQPSDSGKGLTSEPEPEPLTPNPLAGGDHAFDLRESFQPFASAYAAPITDMAKALFIWSALAPAERSQAIIGAKGYASYIDAERKAGRNRAVKDAHRWLRDRLWLGYLDAGRQAEAMGQRFEATEESEQWQAWMVFYLCCGEALGIPAFLITGPAPARRASVPREWPPVGRGIDPDPTSWVMIQEGTGPFAAWARRLRELPGTRIRSRGTMVDGRSVQALKVPSEWPPNRNATGPSALASSDKDFARDQGLG
jgi:hypothetical protein